MWHGLKGVKAYLYHESQAACFKKARDDLYKVKAWVFSPQVKVIRSDIREEDVLKEKDAFEDLKKLAAKSLTETVNQLIDTVNQVKEDQNAEQATRPSRVTDASSRKRGILRTNNRLPLHCPSHYFGLYSKKKKTVKKDTSSDDSSDMRVKKHRGSTVREKLSRDCHLHSEGEGEAKRALITYCITYILNCITKHSPQYIILMVGRILRGIATSLLFSAFESWLVAEHNKMKR
ncbi:unnamed protein product [Lactuca saligna]|uniref:Uncharacterized protein n=1 Tax=Lactuca saligna TaxID=75948 RepID=A0AA35ZVT8_LACSI|nr:unnamed protein product [Lactuca saligna]